MKVAPHGINVNPGRLTAQHQPMNHDLQPIAVSTGAHVHKYIAALLCVLFAPSASADQPYVPYEAYQARFYQRLGAECIQRAGPAVQCFELLETSLDFDAKAPIVHFTLGKYYQALGDNERAIGAFSRALELDPSLLPSMIALGDAYLATGKVEEGRKYYNRFIAVAPRDPIGPYSVGASYAQALDEETALVHLKRAMALGYGDAEALSADPRWRNVVGSPELDTLIEKMEPAKQSQP